MVLISSSGISYARKEAPDCTENNDPAGKRASLPLPVPVPGLRRAEHMLSCQYTWRESIIIPCSHLFSMVALYPGPVEVGGIRLRNHLLLAAG
ncbi:MAG: hypothetical protein PHT74_02610, partial [Methanoculleus horonobensis]|nr:hypothetical protein [Methanoculleus horonobensis]